MKTLRILLVLLFVGTLTYAQTPTEIELFQSEFKADKKVLVANFMELSDAESTAFWKVYNAYELERGKMGDKRIQLLKQYADNYESLTDEQAKEWTNEVFKMQKKEIEIKKKYYKRMSKELSPLTALRFIQLEEYFRTMISASILENIPFVGDY